jgi:hypothetical protein
MTSGDGLFKRCGFRNPMTGRRSWKPVSATGRTRTWELVLPAGAAAREERQATAAAPWWVRLTEGRRCRMGLPVPCHHLGRHFRAGGHDAAVAAVVARKSGEPLAVHHAQLRHGIRVTLHAALNAAVRRGLLTSNPARFVVTQHRTHVNQVDQGSAPRFLSRRAGLAAATAAFVSSSQPFACVVANSSRPRVACLARGFANVRVGMVVGAPQPGGGPE